MPRWKKEVIDHAMEEHKKYVEMKSSSILTLTDAREDQYNMRLIAGDFFNQMSNRCHNFDTPIVIKELQGIPMKDIIVSMSPVDLERLKNLLRYVIQSATHLLEEIEVSENEKD